MHNELLIAPKPPETVPPELCRATVATKGQKPNHTLMVTYINSNGVANLTSLIGITKWANSLNPRSAYHVTMCHAVVKWVGRNDFATTYPKYYEAFFQQFGNDVLLTAWRKATSPRNKVKQNAAEFCAQALSLASSVLPATELNAVLNAKGDYSQVVAEITTLVNSGDAGMEMWPFALVKVLSGQIDNQIAEMATEWVEKGVLTNVGLQEKKSEIVKVIRDIEKFDLVPDKRLVNMKCCQHEFTVQVESIVHHISVQLSFAWRPMAVQQGKMEQLFCEDLVLSDPKPLSTNEVGACLYDGAAAARSLCNKNFKVIGDLTGLQTSSYMKRTRADYEAYDPDFDADAQLILSVSGMNSEVRLLKAMLKACPTSEEPKDVQDVLHVISAMVNDNVFKFAEKPAQVKHNAFKNVLCALVDSKCPDVSGIVQDPAMAQLTDSLSYFWRFTYSASAAHANAQTGLPALQALKAELEAKAATGGDIQENDTMLFKQFAFLIPKSDIGAYETLRQKASKDGKAKIRKAASKSKKANPKDKAVAEAMAMFT